MSDTPRTDEQINGKPCTRFEVIAGDSLRNASVPSEFARQLERELNAANAKIKRLGEAGDEFSEILSSKTPKANCLCHIAPPCSDCVEHWGSREALVNWRKAKEDKP